MWGASRGISWGISRDGVRPLEFVGRRFGVSRDGEVTGVCRKWVGARRGEYGARV